MSVSDKQLAKMPHGLSYEQAGSLPLVALTALQARWELTHWRQTPPQAAAWQFQCSP